MFFCASEFRSMCFRCDPYVFYAHVESEKVIINKHIENLQKHLSNISHNTFSTELSNIELTFYQSIAEILQCGTCVIPLKKTLASLQSIQQNALDDMLFEDKDPGVLFFRGSSKITFSSNASECVRLHGVQMTVNQNHWIAEMCHAHEIMRLWCSFPTK